jgi:protein-tyrosine-phosphatase/predicted ATP-grasp superfamily ATP-dependent carboligase
MSSPTVRRPGTGPVLVLGDDTRSFLATVRSLGRKGLEVHAAPFHFDGPALKSRYVQRVHRIPYYLGDGQAWLEAMQAVVAEHGIEFIIPCEERSLLPLRRHRDAFAQCKLGIVNDTAFDAFFDKAATHTLAERCGVPSPALEDVTQASSAEDLVHRLGLPLACKWNQSYTWPDLYVRTKVAIVHSTEELRKWLSRAAKESGRTSVEAFAPGVGLGVSVLAHEGKVLQAFEHHRVNELDGASFLRVSRPVHAERLKAVERMAAAVNMTGIAMFEFKHDAATEQWALLEVNARPWGSMPLPVALGVDFPAQFHALLCKGEAPTQTPYALGIMGRNLIPDLQQLRMRLKETSHLGALLGALAWTGGLLRRPLGREHWDVWTADDPLPGRTELRSFVQSVKAKLMPARAPTEAQQPALASKRDDHAPGRVIFVCLGNICRSPYAAERAKQLLVQAGLSGWEVRSAGTLPRQPRPSPALAIECAGRHGVDLQEHRSTTLDFEWVDWADQLVVFDDTIRDALLARHPEARTKLRTWSELSPGAAAAGGVADPFGKERSAFEHAYAQIDTVLTAWITALRGRQP